MARLPSRPVRVGRTRTTRPAGSLTDLGGSAATDAGSRWACWAGAAGASTCADVGDDSGVGDVLEVDDGLDDGLDDGVDADGVGLDLARCADAGCPRSSLPSGTAARSPQARA